jgi:predicted AlkP superfamily pyrophosphatase or phosphodiesterase
MRAAEAPPARHVIVFGIDGLSVDGVVSAHTPRMHLLMARAAWTLTARAVMPTLSSPNWESIITGSAPEQHGITSNGYFRKMVEFEPVCRDSEGKFPTIFELLRTADPGARIAVFHDWAGFADLLEKDVPDVLRHEHGAAKTTAAAIAYWRENQPDLMFIHLDNVDHAGHAKGWSSPAYYQAVEEADAHLGAVLDMLAEADPAKSTYVLVTSDHGGKGRGHGKNSLAEIQIPWILSGPGIAAGKVSVPVNTFDTAATVAWIFRLTTPPCWIARPVLAAFQPQVVAARTPAPGVNCAPRSLITASGRFGTSPDLGKGGN